MKRSYIIVAIGLILMALLPACQTEKKTEKPPHFFVDFFVRYLKAEREWKAQASFFEGDSIKNARPVAFEGGVAFQGSAMEARHLPGGAIRYQQERQAEYTSPFQFVYPDDEGQRQEYTLAMAPIDTFYITAGQFSKSQGLTLYTRGGKLDAGESLVLLFSNEDRQASTLTLQGPTAGEMHQFSSSQLMGLSTGSNQLYLVKKRRITQQGPSRSVLANIEFYTPVVEIEVTE